MGAHELAFVGLAGSSLGTALGMPMVWPRSSRPLDVRLLGAAVLLMAAIAALISARLAGLVPASAEVEHAINVLGLSTFPLLVLYTLYVCEAAAPLRHAVWWWLPAVAYVGVAGGRAMFGVDTRVPFAHLLPIVLAFTTVSVVILVMRGERRSTAVVPAEWVVAFVVILNAAQIVRMEFGHIAVVRAVVPLALSVGFVAMAAFAAWRTAAATSTATVAAAAPRYERSGLEEPVALDLLARIDQTLTRDRLFARADLTLADLATAVDATPHQVSEVLNRYANVSFHDLVNRRRVADVKEQLRDPASDAFTIEGIGASAGFGSRSALYAAFRRFERTTPTAFRTSRRSESGNGS
jgi:AraC-like DNA-binding protein